MLKKLKRNNQGFTIIEVLIVLAIAGLILLIVFLAVPALQRNSRNTQRKDDIARLGGAVQEFENNHSGTAPAVGVANCVAPGCDAATLYTNAGTMAYYSTAANVSVADGQALTAVTNGSTIDTVVIYTGGVCGNMAAGGGRGANKGTTRQTAIVYMTEPSGANNDQCTDF